jgi:hypothetical protein
VTDIPRHALLHRYRRRQVRAAVEYRHFVEHDDRFDFGDDGLLPLRAQFHQMHVPRQKDEHARARFLFAINHRTHRK